MEDYARLPDELNLLSEGYTTNWKRERFEIHKTNPTYKSRNSYFTKRKHRTNRRKIL